jgi:carbamoyltransferase
MSALAVLGINATHDASACLLLGGELRVAIAEERLSRRKHHHLTPPYQAITACLEECGLPDLHAVDCIVVNERYPSDFAGELLRDGFRGELLVNPSHHLLHAYYAAAASDQAEAAILVVDGSGYSYVEHQRHGSPLLGPPPAYDHMEETESSFALAGGSLELVGRRWGLWDAQRPYFRFPSLGHMYSVASQYIFGHWVHAGKTMGLAPYGDPHALPEPIVSYGEDGIAVDTEWPLRLPPRSDLPAHLDSTCQNVAAKVQAEIEEALLFLARQLHEATGISHLCFSGGVALNSVANAKLRREGPFSELFVTPAAGDSGIAVGAAAYGHAHLTGEIPRWSGYTDFLGPSPQPEQIDVALRAARNFVRAETPPDAPMAAAREIASGAVVGWFEGRGELGPRALGHRSIVCDPRSDSIRDHLNEWVKFREPFRPYAASVLEEHAHRYFELEWTDRFMLSVVRVRPEFRDLLPSICHVDGTCRIQMVPAGAGRYRRLVESFLAVSELPMILNTSLNIRGEPIVGTPEQALECFLTTNIDTLYLDGRRIEKATLDAEAPDLEMVPHPNRGVALEQASTWEGSWSHSGPHARTRVGHRIQLGELEAQMLAAVDGDARVGDLVGDERSGAGADKVSALRSLQRRGLISLSYPGDPNGPRA